MKERRDDSILLWWMRKELKEALCLFERLHFHQQIQLGTTVTANTCNRPFSHCSFLVRNIRPSALLAHLGLATVIEG